MSDPIHTRQPPISVPLLSSRVRSIPELREISGLQGVLPLYVDTPRGRYGIEFVVDSGAMFASVGIDRAVRAGIPVPPDDSPEYPLPTAAVGATYAHCRIKVGRVRFWWTRKREGDPFDWPILFYTHPANMRTQKPLLGLGGVITTCSWTIVGPQSTNLDDGSITFADVRPVKDSPG